MSNTHRSYWTDIRQRYAGSPLGIVGLVIVCTIAFIALYAPFFASSKPLFVVFDGHWYFPLFRYFLSASYFTKTIDLFCNTLALWLPLYLIASYCGRLIKGCVSIVMLGLFLFAAFFHVIDPAIDSALSLEKQTAFNEYVRQGHFFPDFDFELRYMNDYAKLNMALDELNKLRSHQAVVAALPKGYNNPYTLYLVEERTYNDQVEAAKENKEEKKLQYLIKKKRYMEHQLNQISCVLYPLIRIHHWEEDIGGDQQMNRILPFSELSRIGRQDLVSALIFGARISLFVGIVSTLLSLLIGIPFGLISGYYGRRVDMALCRFIEVWEAMPAFFMLLMIVTLVESKSIFLVISVIALFNWTTSFRYVRAETFRQREMAYIDASYALGFPVRRILFSDLLPNCIVPIVALLPFDIMAAITREAGLAFLGLGEERSCSWGVLMDEGRSAFPQESALLWPPAIALTVLLMGIAFVGNTLQTALDPKSS